MKASNLALGLGLVFLFGMSAVLIQPSAALQLGRNGPSAAAAGLHRHRRLLQQHKRQQFHTPTPTPNPAAAPAAAIKPHQFPIHWGAPPQAQRRDLVAWPDGYGRGSSTVKDWIVGNQKLDGLRDAETKVKAGPVPGSTAAGDLVAIGDIHGSLSSLYRTLLHNKLVDESGDWIGGERTVVQTGDLLGRGPDDKDVIEFIMRLQTQADAAGGKWVQLMGNHEWMELNGNYKYANDGPGGKGYGSVEARDRAFTSGDHGKWLRSNKVMHQWHDVVFLHGGLANPSMASYGVDALNEHVTAYFKGEHAETRVANELLWSRTLATGDEQKVCPQLKSVLAELGATKMVVGHTITASTGEFKPGELGSRCGGALRMIDVGISSAFADIPKLWSAAHFYKVNAAAVDREPEPAAPTRMLEPKPKLEPEPEPEPEPELPSTAMSAQELLELEAMAEAIAAPRVGPNGEDRSNPGYREGNGNGRKDYVGPKLLEQ